MSGFPRSRARTNASFRAPALLTITLASFAFATAALAQFDAPAPKALTGEQQFARQCGTCHTLHAADGERQGPTLEHVYGRKAGSVKGYAYSSGFAKADFVWDESHLDAWLTNPQAVIPGAVMPYRQAKPEVRAAVIGYLKGLKWMTAKAVHSMVRVLEEKRSVDFYDKAFGLKLADKYDFGSFALIYLRNDKTPFEVELTVNGDQKEPYDLGNGYGHLAVTVDSVEAEHKRMAGAGLKPGDVKDFKHEGKTLARFFFISDPDGYKIEVIERGGRFV